MQKFIFILCMLHLVACSDSPEYLNNNTVNAFKLKTTESSKLKYYSTSKFYKDSSRIIRFADSNNITYKLLSSKENNRSTNYKWELLPGSNKKEVADTLFNEYNEKGIYAWYNEDLFEGAADKILLLPFPLKAGQSWDTKFLAYPAKAVCIDTDTLLSTHAGQFHCFRIDFTFSPEYMYEDFIKDRRNNKIEGVYSTYNSEYGLIQSSITYSIVNKKDSNKRWVILTNTTSISDLLLKE